MIVSAEIGLQHCGCLGTAFAFVDAVADAGVDVAKLQCHDGDPCNQFRPGMENYFPQDRDRQAYWARTSFNAREWAKLAAKIHKRGLGFCCSVFSVAGIAVVRDFVQMLKIPSSKTNDHDLLRAAAATGKPIVLSTGMSDVEEIYRAIDVVVTVSGRDPTVLNCVSEYPTPPEHVLFNSRTYRWGLSDHSGQLWPGIIAAWEGAHMLELHCCWSRQQWGPDVSSSLTIEEIEKLVRGIRFVEKMRTPNDKNDLARQLEPVRRVFRG